MIKSLTVRNYIGDEITITLTELDPDHGLYVKSITGLGPPKGVINTSDYAVIDGSLYNSARAEKRNIVMQLLFRETTNCPDVETARQNTYRYFPLKRQLTLIFETDHRLVEIKGYVESNEPNIFSEQESNQISIICDDPFFYEVGENNPQITYFSNVTSLFEFEFDNNDLDERLIELSKYETTKEKVLVYSGDAETGIIIRVHVLDSIGNITVYNFLTKERMFIDNSKIEALTGEALKEADELIISTMENNQYVNLLREGNTVNVLNAVDRSSDWIQLRPGDNVLAFTTDNETDDNLEFSVENRVLFWGI